MPGSRKKIPDSCGNNLSTCSGRVSPARLENCQPNGFRTKSDSRTAYFCAIRAKSLLSASAVNALIGATFRRKRAVLRSVEIGFQNRSGSSPTAEVLLNPNNQTTKGDY
jgi:hypothetical protein